MSYRDQSWQPTVLCILDGFGIGPASKSNAIALAKMTVFKRLQRRYPHTSLQTSGSQVGLPRWQAGNSEAGHANIGAGRIVKQDSVRILDSIADGTFYKNPAFISAVKHVREHQSAVHLMGLLSGDQSGHAHPAHLLSLLKFFRKKKVRPIYLHLFTDGRDSSPYSAGRFLRRLQDQLEPQEQIATISGRYYAMDRNKRWDRTATAYAAMVHGRGVKADNAEAAVASAYDRGETDEYLQPAVMVRHGRPIATIDDGDAVIFFNLRSDRARQLTKPFVQSRFEQLGGFRRGGQLRQLYFVALTDFGPDLDTVVAAFPAVSLTQTLPMALAGYRQLYIAESEKYAHMTYFLNGGYADPVAGEDRVMIPSPTVSHYDQRPAMSAKKITTRVLRSLRGREHQFVALNFANPDMLAHTGNLAATIAGLKVVDECLGKLYHMVVLRRKGNLIITADHGNAEVLRSAAGAVVTEHTRYPVPFIMATADHHRYRLRRGNLANVAPTVLAIMGVTAPADMTASPLYSPIHPADPYGSTKTSRSLGA
ncbi:MAG: 2,3-bisphosphoglycerate-independent phosphoglycerate mutase [Patescibacteria group bacterium]